MPPKADPPEDYVCSFERIGRRLGIRQRTKALRPAQILDAALDEFCQKGYEATRVEDIAKRARISKALVYVYYPTKIDLFLAVAERIVEPYSEAGNTFRLDEMASAESQLRGLHDLFYDTIAYDAQALRIFRLMLAESHRAPEIAAFYRRNFLGGRMDAIHALLRHGMARGEFAATAEARLAGVEDILGSPAAMIMLVQVLTGEASEHDRQRWHQTHWDMVMAFLKQA